MKSLVCSVDVAELLVPLASSNVIPDLAHVIIMNELPPSHQGSDVQAHVKTLQTALKAHGVRVSSLHDLVATGRVWAHPERAVWRGDDSLFTLIFTSGSTVTTATTYTRDRYVVHQLSRPSTTPFHFVLFQGRPKGAMISTRAWHLRNNRVYCQLYVNCELCF